MAAHIVKRPRPAVSVPRQNDGVAIQFESEIVTGFWNLTGMSGKNPARPPYPLAIHLIHLFIGIKLPEHGMPGWRAIKPRSRGESEWLFFRSIANYNFADCLVSRQPQIQSITLLLTATDSIAAPA